MFRTSLSTLCFFFSISACHSQQTPEIPDPIVQFWKKVAKARTITYTMKSWGNYQGTMFAQETKPGKSVFYVLQTYEVKAQRPNRLSVTSSDGIEREVVEDGQGHREFLLGQERSTSTMANKALLTSRRCACFKPGREFPPLEKTLTILRD